MNVKPFRLGMGQMLVVSGAVSANLERARKMILRAAGEGCAAVLLPECLNVGWTAETTRELAEAIPGAHSEVLSAAAREAGIHVVAGLAERFGDRIYNSAVLLSPAGEILSLHRKIHELSIAAGLYATGDRLSVVETPLGRIGVNICADNFPDSLVLGHALGRMGCQVLLSPCAWAVEREHENETDPYGKLWLDAYGELARLYDMTVVGVSSVGRLAGGPWAGRKCIGCSLAVGPGGRMLARGPYGVSAEALITVEVSPLRRIVTGEAMSAMLRGKGYTGH